jgi:hypothetical protein
MFASFGDARCKIEGGEVVKSREMYFALYQTLASDERRPGLYREFAPDFFDLVIVDECHRGSAREESNWREILTYFGRNRIEYRDCSWQRHWLPQLFETRSSRRRRLPRLLALLQSA